MTEAQVSRKELERALREILKLLDITRDIERNQADNEFSRGGGKIHYVFDENIFEMLIRPWEWQSRTATFYSRFWLKAEDAGQVRDWASVAAQSALLAGEHLFSGVLPGQQDQKIYMTEWHMWELRRRLGDLISELQAATVAHPTRKSSRRRGISDVPFLEEDLKLLARDGQIWATEAIDRFVIARTMADALASDHEIEPIRQVQRLVTAPIRDRLALLDERFHVPPTEFGNIAGSAEVWLARLKEELEHYKDHDRSQRRPGSLKSDARSLAYLQWAARRCGPEERVVMVTGDDIVFDAYRRWHSSQATGSLDYFQPFCLRRPVQFAPIFNMNDAEGDISGAEELFEQTRAAVEVALLPFNLSQISVPGDRTGAGRQVDGADAAKRAERSEAIKRGREYLALRRHDVGALFEDPAIALFGRNLREGWLPQSRDSLSSLTRLWRQAERIAIGSMYQSLAPRLTPHQIAVAESRADPGAEDLGPALTQHIRALFDTIVENSVKVWYPLAAQFIARAIETASAEEPTRVRPPINLSFGQRHQILPANLGELFEFIRSGRTNRKRLAQAQQEFADQPHLLFTIASVLALSLGSWSEAERFADLAQSSAELTTGENALPDDDREELLYLHALTKRFRLGEIGTARSLGAQQTARQRFTEARALLDRCVALPGSDDVPGETAPRAAKNLRALSERAALNLFYFASLRLDRDGLAKSTNYEPSNAEGIIAAAEADLAACIVIHESLNVVSLDDDSGNFLASVRRQFVSNIAAASLARSVTGQGATHEDLVSPVAFNLVQALSESEADKLPDVVQLELAIYNALRTSDSDGLAGLGNRRSRPEAVVGLVRLDQAIERAVTRLAKL